MGQVPVGDILLHVPIEPMGKSLSFFVVAKYRPKVSALSKEPLKRSINMKKSLFWAKTTWGVVIAVGIYAILLGGLWDIEYILCYPLFYFVPDPDWAILYLPLQSFIFGIIAKLLTDRCYRYKNVVVKAIISALCIVSLSSVIMILATIIGEFNLQAALRDMPADDRWVWKSSGAKITKQDNLVSGIIVGVVILLMSVCLLIAPALYSINALDD